MLTSCKTIHVAIANRNHFASVAGGLFFSILIVKISRGILTTHAASKLAAIGHPSTVLAESYNWCMDVTFNEACPGITGVNKNSPMNNPINTAIAMTCFTFLRAAVRKNSRLTRDAAANTNTPQATERNTNTPHPKPPHPPQPNGQSPNLTHTTS